MNKIEVSIVNDMVGFVITFMCSTTLKDIQDYEAKYIELLNYNEQYNLNEGVKFEDSMKPSDIIESLCIYSQINDINIDNIINDINCLCFCLYLHKQGVFDIFSDKHRKTHGVVIEIFNDEIDYTIDIIPAIDEHTTEYIERFKINNSISLVLN